MNKKVIALSCLPPRAFVSLEFPPLCEGRGPMQQEAEGLLALAVQLMGEQFYLLQKKRDRQAVKAVASILGMKAFLGGRRVLSEFKFC